MPVFKGKYMPPAVAPTVSVVAIGGAGRCEITAEKMIFEGSSSSVSPKTIALGLAAGVGFVLIDLLLDAIGLVNLSPTLIAGSFACGLVSVGMIRHQRADKGRPVRYEVKLSGVKRVEPSGEDPRTLLIEAPGIRSKAAIFFQPAEGVEGFLAAYRRLRAEG